jgi:membrane protein DedA with SNARE-associated domain
MTDLASLTSHLTDGVARHGIVAVFVLMAVDALLPVGGELIMLYAGVVAGTTGVALLGTGLASGFESYLAMALAGTLGYLAGALVGWAIGARGGRPFVERHGRWLHLPPASVDRAERWFARYGEWAVLLGRITPVARSFISIPAGMFGSRLATYVPLTLLGSALWCFAFAGAGWAVGDNWERVHSAFRYVDIVVVLAAVAVVGWLLLRRRRRAAQVG